MQGTSKLSSLMELYIGNNRVDDLKEVLHIKGMSTYSAQYWCNDLARKRSISRRSFTLISAGAGKLIILDLSGNQLCSALDYRHYTIYHVRKLKVLDGAGVEMAEQEAAKDKYDGKLTTEFVVERVGHSFLEHVRELNLAASRVRDVGDVLTEASFPSLKELNLENNQLVDLSGLLDLPLLTILRLNHNRVEHLGLVADGDHLRPVLPHLEVLQLGYNHINYIPSLRLHCLPELKSLFLQGNDITKIEGLDRCTQLRELILDKNKIKAVSQNSLTSLANLRTLRIECVSLRDSPGRLFGRGPPLLTPCFSPCVFAARMGCGRCQTSRRSRDCRRYRASPTGSASWRRLMYATRCLCCFVSPPSCVGSHTSESLTGCADGWTLCVQKIAQLPSLTELNLSTCPVCRKQLYRPTLIKKFPALRLLDAKCVSLEERERTEVNQNTQQSKRKKNNRNDRND